MAERRDRPGWSEPVSNSDAYIVTCPTCGRAMRWRDFLEHGPTCDGDDGDD